MAGRITPGQIKKTNQQSIYEYIYRNEKVSQQDISYALHLSRPTVATNLAELEEDGLIRKDGQWESDQIGRKAAAYSVTPDFRVAVGVEILTDRVKIIAVDLLGKKIDRKVLKIPYNNQDAYFEEICHSILAFLSSLKIPEEKVLGVGITMLGLVSADRQTMTYGAILDCTGLGIDAFTRHLPFPCSFLHDPDAAALSELWSSPELTNAVYLSLSQHLGGSLISQRNIVTGKHGHTATFEHIQLRARGELCYCGNRGCAETLCSMSALLGEEDPDQFFEALRDGADEPVRRWKTYLKSLATLIGMLHLVYDVDFILGGHLAVYFTPSDIRFLYEEIRRSCPFEDSDDYISISKMPSHNISIGAALPYIQKFLDDVGAAAATVPQ